VFLCVLCGEREKLPAFLLLFLCFLRSIWSGLKDPSFFIEKSKRRIIAEDIGTALKIAS
jgi:hypothetical protein